MKKSDKMSRIVLGFVKLTGLLPAFLLFKPKVYLENKSCKRSLGKNTILMSNHTSLLDFVLYVLLFPLKSIHFLMAEVLFNKGKAFSWFLYKIGGIFVDRDACNFSFVEDSLSILEKNGSVAVFPQGRLPVGGKPFEFKPGIVLIALRCNAPIIPVYTDGNYGFFKRARVMIGEKIYISDYTTVMSPEDANSEELKRLAKILEDKVYSLKAELEKRVGDKNGKQK